MLGFLTFACLVTAASCACKADLASWSQYEQCMKDNFLQPQSSNMFSCYNQSGCPDSITVADVKNNSIFKGGCRIYSWANGLNCSKFYDCINQVGTVILADATPCINNFAEYATYRFPAATMFLLEHASGLGEFSGICNRTNLTNCMRNTNVNGDTLQNQFCSVEHSCAASSFTNCNMPQLAPLITSCLNSTYASKQGPYTQQMFNCMGSQAFLINSAAVTNAMYRGFNLIATQFPSATCGLG